LTRTASKSPRWERWERRRRRQNYGRKWFAVPDGRRFNSEVAASNARQEEKQGVKVSR
jgi:hypothetical protein